MGIGKWNRRESMTICMTELFFDKSGPFAASFYLFSSFQYSKQTNVQHKFADDWSRTADLWYWKQPLNQLSHNHFPRDMNFARDKNSQ